MPLSACTLSLLATDEQCHLNDTQLQANTKRLLEQYTSLKYSRFSSSTLENDYHLNVTLMGPTHVTMVARGDVLRQTPLQSKCMIYSFHPDVLAKASALHDSLNDIATEQGTTLQVICQSKPAMVIYGDQDAVYNTRTQVLLLLDQQLGLSTGTIDIPCYLQYLIAGKRHQNLQMVMEETSTNLYLESPFVKLSDMQHMSLPVDQRYSTLHLSGSLNGIERAKELVKKLVIQKKNSMYHKCSMIKPAKLDWLLRSQREQITKIMEDNGSAIIFPAIGSGCNSVTVYAENRINAERSFRLLNYLTYSIYEVSFIFKYDDNASEESSAQHIFGSLEKLALILTQLSHTSGAELIYRGDTRRLDAIGSHQAIQRLCSSLRAMNFFKAHTPMVIFSIEMAAEQREFISGKKNGKINKIMKTCDVQLSFTATNEYNVIITVESKDMVKALTGLAMLQDELPAETSFYVPEVYHRRIIGVGGKNIQRVMKKFGVYVKFSGAEEFAAMGGYFENEHNVVARTPMKNKANLCQLQEAVMEFITSDKDKDFTVCTLSIPLSWRRRLLTSQLAETERMFHTRVLWPSTTGMDQVALYGPRSQLPYVVAFLQSKVPQDLYFIALLGNNNKKENVKSNSPATTNSAKIGSQPDNEQDENVDHTLAQWQQRIQHELKQHYSNVELVLQPPPPPSHYHKQLSLDYTRVQWKWVFHQYPDGVHCRLRYFETTVQAAQLKRFLLQQCQDIPIVFETDLNDTLQCSSPFSNPEERYLPSLDDILPPSPPPSSSPCRLTRSLTPPTSSTTLFDPSKPMYDTAWSMFSVSPHPPSSSTLFAPYRKQQQQQQQQHHYPAPHPFQQQGINHQPLPPLPHLPHYHLNHHHPHGSQYQQHPAQHAAFETTKTMMDMMMLPPLPPLPPSSGSSSSSFFMGKPLPSFSTNILYQHQHQHHRQQQQQQQQQQQFLQDRRASSSPLTTSHQKLDQDNKSWATPGGRPNPTRYSCPNIFLAPDLFASTSLRRASVGVPPSNA